MQAKQQNDPVIDEVRDVRHRISARFGHDPARLVAYYQELQEQFRERLLERPVPTLPPAASAEVLHGD
jgi:hypothetical protein